MTGSEKHAAGYGLTLLALGITAGLVVLALCGCASDSAFKRAGCTRFRFGEYNILACNDRAVGEHCKKICPRTDFGGVVDYLPRACFKPSIWGRRSTVFIGGSYMGCLPHELCHLEGHPPKDCALKYPCVEDARP